MSAPFAHAFDWARRHVDSGGLPTAVLGVATASGIAAVDAFGATGTRRARVEDHYRLFSITKPLVGLAAARMIERGSQLRRPRCRRTYRRSGSSVTM